MAGTEDSRRGPGRWLRVVLFASLALNLLVVGAVAGFLLKGPVAPRGEQADPALPYTRAFDDTQRRALRRELRRTLRSGDGPVRDGYLDQYRQAVALLRSDPFDRAAMEALLAEQAARGARVRAGGQKVLSDVLSGMTPAERRAYADRLEHEVEHMHHHGPRLRAVEDD